MTEQSAHQVWESRYNESEHIWSGNPNKVLVDTVASFSPGSALELGCGEGADAIWLALAGWQVTALEVSTTALERAQRAAADAGVPAGSVTWVAQDLAHWHPHEEYDLVSAFFLHSHTELPRAEILCRAASAVAVGGHLLVVGHAEPPWAGDDSEATVADDDHDHAHDFLSPQEQFAQLELPPEHWQSEVVDLRARQADAPDGTVQTIDDVVVLVRRIS